jgi:hypothetical protein
MVESPYPNSIYKIKACYNHFLKLLGTKIKHFLSVLKKSIDPFSKKH